MNLSRRRFLKAAGLIGITAIAGGCDDATRKLIPFVVQPEDIVPGEAVWYATTCRECPAGCGILAKNRDGRVIKVEGNPLHPVNTGKLCVRGQASVQGVYNPDRYRGPLARRVNGSFQALSWEEAEKAVMDAFSSSTHRKKMDRVVFLTDLTTGTERDVVRRFLEVARSNRHIMYEALAYEALRKSNNDIFGNPVIPAYSIDRADLIISFGANFLETWLSNVRFARQFARFREPAQGKKNPFVYVGPRLSLTGASADLWIETAVGGECLVALGLLHILLQQDHGKIFDGDGLPELTEALAHIVPEMIAERTGVKKETLFALANLFMQAKRPLVLAEGLGYEGPHAYETACAANLLNCLKPGTMEAIDFSAVSSLSRAARADEMKRLTADMRSGNVDALFILRANPVFHLPPQWGFADAMRAVPLVVSLSSFPDETTQASHFILPGNTFLESWGDYEPCTGVRSLMQPAMGPLFDTRVAGDILLSLGRRHSGAKAFPENDFYEVLHNNWMTDNVDWQKSLQQGGVFNQGDSSHPQRPKKLTISIPDISAFSSAAPSDKTFAFIAYPTIQFFDGRGANRPFLQELPDPLTSITWDGWVEINPETAAGLGIHGGDMLRLESASGSVEAAAFLFPGLQRDTLAMPIGQGHSTFGRYANGATTNPLNICGSAVDAGGGVIRATTLLKVARTGRSFPLAHTDGATDQHDRDIVRSIDVRAYFTSAHNSAPVVLPLPQGFSAGQDFYPPHKHDEHRWIMVVDLDRCIGCGACVTACYAENNVAVVGREEVLRGREMAWLHIQRYFEKTGPLVRFLPMLCQHCDEAPCESVCPVFAPHHSKEGINNQVYNRCIGTRYCSQNCPYKVRRFNWRTWRHDSPLEWQLNPDVTVREKGVMEKCSFCIQRIAAAKIQARSENRPIKDGVFTTACAQTCPADALVFGDLKDSESRAAKLIREARAYQVLGELNTKPGVIYLKKITQQLI